MALSVSPNNYMYQLGWGGGMSSDITIVRAGIMANFLRIIESGNVDHRRELPMGISTLGDL